MDLFPDSPNYVKCVSCGFFMQVFYVPKEDSYCTRCRLKSKCQTPMFPYTSSPSVLVSHMGNMTYEELEEYCRNKYREKSDEN